MALTLWYHPFASFCWKVQIALDVASAAFDGVIVDLGDPASHEAFLAIWPIGKFPVIRTDDGEMIPESTIIIDYLAARYPEAGLIPADADTARAARLWDRFCDFSVQLPMQKIVGDRLRPASATDAYGVEEARGQLRTAYDILEDRLADRAWLSGSAFTIADCAAAPALHYAEMVEPWTEHPALTAYLARLKAHSSVAHVLAGAEPYAHFFPEPR